MGAVELLEQDDARQLVGKSQLAKREPMIDLVKVQPERAPDDEAQVPATPATLFQEAAEGDRVELLTGPIEQRHECPVGQAPGHMLVLPYLDHLDAGVSGQQLVVMLVVIGERLPQPAHGDDDDPHG